ncbi:MAG: valine--tRNA ligase [Patescibacteria group bacterium]
MSNTEMPKAYESKSYEDEIYAKWLKSGFFNPDNLPGERTEVFSMILPPPNATGVLHMGHAVMLAVQDILARYHRMRGKKVLWLPGTDHAAIATNVKVEKILQKQEGKSRHDLGRDLFIKRVEDFVEQSRSTINHQVSKMGSSVDWSREAFTLDESRNLAVRTMFKKMFDDGLIYRGYRVVNWDPVGQTVISDDEIVYKESVGKFYTFKYANDFPIAISTTRPETKVGDTAVAVHPNDERYQSLIGQTFEVVFAGVPLTIKIIADENVDPAFGTGALGVTPAHSMVDFEMSQKHGLPLVRVIDEHAKMTKEAGLLVAGLDVLEAREKIVEWIRENGLLEKEEDVQQNLSTAERTGAVIEPTPMLQWFVNVNKEFPFHASVRAPMIGLIDGQMVTLKQLMQQAVLTKQTQIIPESFEKTYFWWINNLRDWCISRQLWYGHRIPAWYRASRVILSEGLTEAEGSSELYVGVNPPEGDGWIQDEDTLDTWFSAGMWTFSVLGWPNETEDLKTYHPTDMLETGRDLIFFWVARMILMSTYALGEVPFKTTYLHGLVRDDQGRKMSKSLENSIDPLDMIAKYGADATRLSLMIGITPGNDTKLSEDKVASYRNFTNKLWNISRFVLSSVPPPLKGGGEGVVVNVVNPKTVSDKWILSRFESVLRKATGHLDQYEFSQATEVLRDFTWGEFADWYLEIAKVQRLDARLKSSTEEILLFLLERLLSVWHPFMPFVTEAIWKEFKTDSLLMIRRWPVMDGYNDEQSEQTLESLKEWIVGIRHARSEQKIEPKHVLDVVLVANASLHQDIEKQRSVIATLARVHADFLVETSYENSSKDVSVVMKDLTVFLKQETTLDPEKEKARTEKEIAECVNYLESLTQKLSNQEFRLKAPAHIITNMEANLRETQEKLDTLRK